VKLTEGCSITNDKLHTIWAKTMQNPCKTFETSLQLHSRWQNHAGIEFVTSPMVVVWFVLNR